MNIEASIFKAKLENSYTVPSEELGDVKFKWNIETVGGIKILRYAIQPLDDIYEVDVDGLIHEGLTTEKYFQTVVKLLINQVVLYKDGKLVTEDGFVPHPDDLKWIKHFETIFDNIHTGK